MSHLRRKLAADAPLTDQEIGLLRDEVDEVFEEVGTTVFARIDNLQAERYELGEEIRELEDAWGWTSKDLLPSLVGDLESLRELKVMTKSQFDFLTNWFATYGD